MRLSKREETFTRQKWRFQRWPTRRTTSENRERDTTSARTNKSRDDRRRKKMEHKNSPFLFEIMHIVL